MGVISIGKIQCGKDLTCVDNMDTVTSNNGPNGHVWYIAYIRILTFKNWLCPKRIILWLEEIISHHRWLKPYQSWYKQHPSTSLNLCKFFSTHSVSGGKTSVPFYQHHQAQVYSWFGWFNPSAEQIHLTCHPNLPTNCHQYTYIVIFSQSIFFFSSLTFIHICTHQKKNGRQFEASAKVMAGGRAKVHGSSATAARAVVAWCVFFANGINRHGEIMGIIYIYNIYIIYIYK